MNNKYFKSFVKKVVIILAIFPWLTVISSISAYQALSAEEMRHEQPQHNYQHNNQHNNQHNYQHNYHPNYQHNYPSGYRHGYVGPGGQSNPVYVVPNQQQNPQPQVQINQGPQGTQPTGQ